ncbi:MAG: hypothetical protein OEX21_00515 [Betaproteobacteria bacterium]|nr:hypothetical protein [Betaproteobacteria bacterium]
MSAIGRTGFMTRVAAALAVVVGLATFGSGVHASGGNPLSFGKPDFELTGRVYDEATKEPIEGAYVVALYYVDVIGPAALTTKCVRAKGMYTGNDGTFHFPVEKRDGNSPGKVMAIKSGYFSLWPVIPPTDVWKKQGKEAYSGRDLPLQKQDLQKPSWQMGHGDVYCTGAEWREDVEAAIEFLKLRLAEVRRLGLTGDKGLKAIEAKIDDLQSLPTKSRNK